MVNLLDNFALGAAEAITFGLLGLYLRAMDLGGCVAGIGLSLAVVYGTGTRGFLLVATFVIVGSVATRWGYAAKDHLGIAQKKSGQRTALHAVAKLFVPAACALASPFATNPTSLKAAFVAATAAALADTLGTEVGQLCGNKPVLILRRQTVVPGTPGAVSWQGLLAGMVGTVLIGVEGVGVGILQVNQLGLLFPATVLALLAESVCGELSPRIAFLTNPVRNLAVTAMAAVLMILMTVH